MGVANRLDNYNIEVTELPIKKWTSQYKQFLEKLIENGKLEDIREYHENPHINFVLTFSDY